MERFGIRLRHRRFVAGESASALARAAGWTQTYWYQLEDGSRQAPGPDQLDVAARALGVAPSSALLADLTLEALWWSWTVPRTAHLAHRVIRAIADGYETLQDERQWQTVLHLLYPAEDTGRRVIPRLPEVDRTRPDTWPRVLQVDVLCMRVAGLDLGSSVYGRQYDPDNIAEPETVEARQNPGITLYLLAGTEEPTYTAVTPLRIEI